MSAIYLLLSACSLIVDYVEGWVHQGKIDEGQLKSESAIKNYYVTITILRSVTSFTKPVTSRPGFASCSWMFHTNCDISSKNIW